MGLLKIKYNCRDSLFQLFILSTNLRTKFIVCFQVQQKCVHSLISILQHPDRQVAPPYIQGLAPRMIEHLHASAALTTLTSDLDVNLLLEELCMMETLVALAEDNKRNYHFFFTFQIIFAGFTFAMEIIGLHFKYTFSYFHLLLS